MQRPLEKSRDIKIKFRTNCECWQSRPRIHELSRGKSHLVFPHCRHAALLRDERRAPFVATAEKRRKRTDHFRERLRSEARARRETEKDARIGGEEEKNRDANLPSRRRGQLCANAIPFSQVIRKTGHPPRSPYEKSIPLSLSLFSYHLSNPPASRYALMYAHSCIRTLLRDVIRQSRS